MTNKLTKECLDQLKASKSQEVLKNYINVGMSTCGIAAGADSVYNLLIDEAKKRNLSIEVKQCGCLGMCSVEPIVEVAVESLPTVFYGRVTEDVAIKILDEHVQNKKLLDDHIYDVN